MRISRMESFEGSCPPLKPSMKIAPPLGPADGPASAARSAAKSSGLSANASRSCPRKTNAPAFDEGSVPIATPLVLSFTVTFCDAAITFNLRSMD